MPVDLETGLTFGELLVELAERVDLADELGAVVALDDDTVNLDKLKRCLNRGYSEFLRSNTQWSFLRVPLVLTMSSAGTGPFNLDGDPARYRLPSYCTMQPVRNWRYVDQDSGLEEIVVRPYDTVARHRELSSASAGTPFIAGSRAIQTPDVVGRPVTGWETLFHYAPDRDYVVEATFRTSGHRLTALNERHVAGADHDNTILAFAEHWWYEHQQEDPEKFAKAEKALSQRLAASMAIDTHRSATNRGRGIDTTRPAREEFARTTGTWTVNGQAVE